MRCGAAGCINTTKDGVSQHRFPSDPTYILYVFGRLKWSWPERSGRDRQNTHSYTYLYVVHISSRHALNGAFTASSVWLINKVMLLPDAIPTIFPISKKAGKAPTKKRGVFLMRERLRVSGHLVILPCITQSTSAQNHMFTPCLLFQCSWHENMPWFSTWIKHCVWFDILARQT